MGRILVFHRDHCLACRSCELACSVAHSGGGADPLVRAGPPSPALALTTQALEAAIAEEHPPVRRVVLASGSDGVEALRCEQCLEPLCAFACKSGALRRDPLTGRVKIGRAHV